MFREVFLENRFAISVTHRGALLAAKFKPKHLRNLRDVDDEKLAAGGMRVAEMRHTRQRGSVPYYVHFSFVCKLRKNARDFMKTT